MLGYMKRSSYLFLPPMDHGQENETIMMTIEGGKRTLHAGVDFENSFSASSAHVLVFFKFHFPPHFSYPYDGRVSMSLEIYIYVEIKYEIHITYSKCCGSIHLLFIIKLN